jgi:hypothetical protein
MSKLITKILISFGTAICLTSFLGTTIARSQPVDPSCSNLSPSPLNKPDSLLTIEKAIEDASKPEPCQRSTNLIPITKNNPRLIWRTKDGHDQVLMVTWKGDCDSKQISISCKLKDGKYTEDDKYTVLKDDPLWLTAVPEVKEFILIQDYPVKQNQTGGNLSSWLSSRLEKYLGLQPNRGYKYFVEVWVNVEDLQRPCSDSKVVNDTECNFPELGTPYDPRQKTKSPMTGLGYTYDWGNSQTDIGASEFIVKAPATVSIHDIKSTSDYLQGLTPRLQLQQK